MHCHQTVKYIAYTNSMVNTVDRHIELEARERNFLRYEAAFWGVAFLAFATGGAVLMASALTAGGIGATVGAITLGIGAVITYVKRDEVREEYRLKTSSGRDRIAAKHWAEELGVNRQLVGDKGKETQANIAPTEIAPSDKIIADTQHNLHEQNQRADGQAWGDVAQASKAQTADQTLSK